MATKKKTEEFAKGDYVVYPAHGVGEIEGIETQTISGMEIKLYNINFKKRAHALESAYV